MSVSIAPGMMRQRLSIDVANFVRYLFAHHEKGFAAHTLIASDAVSGQRPIPFAY